jgi:hypothetical protein
MVNNKLIDKYIEDNIGSYFQNKCNILDELTLYALDRKKESVSFLY